MSSKGLLLIDDILYLVERFWTDCNVFFGFVMLNTLR